MLIINNRHTQKDIELYNELRELDIFYYKENEKKINYKIDNAIEVIKNWKKINNSIVICTSWGKDSVVLLYCLVKSQIKAKVVYAKFIDRHNPDCELVKDYFLSKYDIDYNEELFNYNDVIKNDLHWKIISKKYSEYRITGIRNDESNIRNLVYKMFGYYSKYSCRPLSLLKKQEIFSFIECNNLPLCSVYGYLGNGIFEREHIRTHSLAGSSGSCNRELWEKLYYKDLLNKIYKNNMFRR